MYIDIHIAVVAQPIKEVLIALLSNTAEGFEETQTGLHIFCKESVFDASEIRHLSRLYQFSYTTHALPLQNWNTQWEQHFEPVVVADFVTVRASFHTPTYATLHEIIITPKMSFGTGHHATTWLMMQQMRTLNFSGKKVFDFGTGTGILAILAKKLGATSIVATDIDNWCMENAGENFATNHMSNIQLLQSASAWQGGGFDIILANINKNVLMETIPDLANQLVPHGFLLLSGLLQADEADVVAQCTGSHLQVVGRSSRAGWISILLTKA